MRDYTETEDTVGSNSGPALESNGNSVARGEALRDAEYASLTRRAATENSRELINEVLRLIETVEARKRRRGAKAKATLRQAVERFVGDLLVALAKAQHNEHAGWVHRSVSPNAFTSGAVPSRTFAAVRAGLVALALVEEAPAVTQFREAFGKRFVQRRYDTRWRATSRLAELATARGVSLLDIRTHFVPELPKHPLVLKDTSTWLGGYKITGKRMKIDYTDETVKAVEQEIIDLNTFIAQCDIRGGTHHGYIREFNCGDHPKFAWDCGGRLYSVGSANYQQMKPAERLKMIIDGQPVCELDIRASALTIFHGQAGQPLDFTSNPDPYAVGELSATRRDVVKAFINATFGNGQLPSRWPQNVSRNYRKETGRSLRRDYPIVQVRGAVARAYPLLDTLRPNNAEPPIWAKLMYLESEAVLRTMLDLANLNIPASRSRTASSFSETVSRRPKISSQIGIRRSREFHRASSRTSRRSGTDTPTPGLLSGLLLLVSGNC
jgi:hypothetical protein